MASGYDLSSQIPFRLMKGRLGVYDKKTFDPHKSGLDGVLHQAAKMEQAGGNLQQERMIKDKRRSLDRATWHSYQGAKVIPIDATDRTPIRALINPNKLKMDYDDKIISVGYEYNFAPGTVFEWVGTGTYWIVQLQDLTELAYFRGDIRRCRYEIAWEDENGKHKTYAAVRGPVETKINYIQKHGISVDTPNLSLNLYLPLNEDTKNYFKRYSKFYLQNDDTCWRVEAIDWISTPGILEVTAIEYYSNEFEDDVKNGIVDGLIEELPDPNAAGGKIIGDTFIQIREPVVYKFNGNVGAIWEVDKKYPITLNIDKDDPRVVVLTWEGSFSGQFELRYGQLASKTIVVESLF